MRVKIGDFLKPVRSSTTIQSDVDYKQVTVRMNNQGVCLRGIKKGSEIKTKKQFLVEPGQFILSKIDARNGAFGLVPNDLDGAIVTQDFPTYSINQQIIDKDYLVLMSSSRFFVDLMRQSSSGTTNRKRLKEEKFLNIEIELPDLVEQKKCVERSLKFLPIVNNSKWLTRKNLTEVLQSQLLGHLLHAHKLENIDLENLCEAIIDCPHSTPTFRSEGVVCLDSRSVCKGYIDNNKIRFVDEKTYVERTKRLIPEPGDIVVVREGSFGSAAIIPSGMKCCLGQRVMLLRPSKRVSPKFLLLLITSVSLFRQFIEKQTGTAAKHVNVRDIKKMSIPLLDLREQVKIGDIVEKALERAKRINSLFQEQQRILQAINAKLLQTNQGAL